MLEIKKTNNRTGEKGNVLFLILIAVALFAALSYAVTQSTRTGGAGSDDETALISSAQLTQYPASVRTAVVRMTIGGVDADDLEFNKPSDYGNCTSGYKYCVFYPTGGGATYAYAPADMMASDGGNTSGEWQFNAENQISLIGKSSGDETPTSSTVDVVAFLPGITETLCNRVNEELGLGTTPPVDDGIDFTSDMVNTDGSTPFGLCNSCGAGNTIGSDTAALDAQPFGCFQNGAAGAYVYYHVLLER